MTVDAAYAKNAQKETLLLSRVLSSELQAHLANKLPTVAAFNLPHENKIAEMLRADLTDTRQAWLDNALTADERTNREATTFLCYKDNSGRFRDFHAFRHTYCVWVLHHLKADVLEAQRLMRVASLAIVQRYAKSFRLGDREAEMIELFPNLTLPSAPPAQKATGTGGLLVACDLRGAANSLSPGGGYQGSLVESGGKQQAEVVAA